MRAARLLVLAAVALLVTACAAAEQPGWTYAPPTEPPPSQAPASEAPASEAPASEAPAGDAVYVSALNIAFEQTELKVPANTTFTLRFENKDAGIPHNVEIRDGSQMTLWKGDIFNGVETRDYTVDVPLAPGSYPFICTVHPNMVGTIVAE